MVVRHFMRKLFSPKYLIWTNVFSGATLLTLGDGIQQYREILHKKKCKKVSQWDYKRSGCMFMIGAVLGLPNHYWYIYMDRILPGVTPSIVARKIVLDEIVASPFLTVSFLAGLGILQGKSTSECTTLVKEKFWTIYMCDLCVWPTLQLINFYYLPLRARVVYVNFCSFIWDIFLSYMVYGYHEHDDDMPTSDVVVEVGKVSPRPETTILSNDVKKVLTVATKSDGIQSNDVLTMSKGVAKKETVTS